jgi:hypothetical protein
VQEDSAMAARMPVTATAMVKSFLSQRCPDGRQEVGSEPRLNDIAEPACAFDNALQKLPVIP